MDDIEIKFQDSFINFVKTFLLLTKKGYISWEYDNTSFYSFLKDIKILRAYKGVLDKTLFFLTKTSDKDPQLCIREKDKVSYPYKFISKREEGEHLIIDIQDVGFSSIIQEFYETVENLIEENERNKQNEKLKEYIDILKPTELLNEKIHSSQTEANEPTETDSKDIIQESK